MNEATGLGRQLTFPVFFSSSPGFIRSTRDLDAESAPFSGGYWLEVSAEEMEQPTTSDALTATDGTIPRKAVAEVFVQVSWGRVSGGGGRGVTG